MAPGEPVASGSEKEKEQYLTKPEKYEPQFSSSDWFAEALINFDADNSIMEQVYSAVQYWTDIALELKSKNYPIAEGIDNWRSFDSKTRLKARMLDDFLDTFITKRLYTEKKDFEVLRVLIAQGKPYLEFKKKMAKVNFSLKCNRIWENDAVAYRCNTCALTPCMSLCGMCFEANGHEGHDYTRFFSREGGACDCGNQDVIREIGNCPKHGDESKRPTYDMSDVCLAERIVTKLLVRLFLDFRGWTIRFNKAEEEYHSEPDEHLVRRPLFDIGEFIEKDAARVNKIVDFLQECSNYGGPMRLIVSQVLMNRDLYKSLTEKTGEHYDESGRVELSLDWRTAHMFIDDQESVLLPDTEKFPLVESLESLQCYTLLDELIFWINRQLFPQNLVNFGLSLLSEPGYRDAFAYRFFAWYPICGKVISELCINQADHSRNDDRVSPACSRAVHVTVQMLSSASLCKELNDKVQLVKTIFDVTRFLICEKLVDSETSLKAVNIFKESPRFLNMLTTGEKWSVMTMKKNAAISQHGYWFVMGDIQNVLTHTPLAVGAVFDNDCFGGSYMRMMCQMQGMNPIWRIVSGNAQEQDGGEDVQRAYTLEFETLAVTLFNIVAAIQQEDNIESARRFFDHVRRQLEKWFYNLLPVTQEERDQVWSNILRAQAYTLSFHIPLHRHISTALTHFTELNGFYEHVETTVLRDEPFLRLLFIHPLRIHVARAEINCGMWVRNGAQARMSSLIYSQWNVSSAFQTPDVDLIRFCAAHIDKEHFVKTLTVSFNLSESIRLRCSSMTRRLSETQKLFAGVGGSMKRGEDEEEVEQYSESFSEYRKLIREQPRLIENIMMNPSGRIPEHSSYDEQQREDIIELLYSGCNSTQMTIDFKISSRTEPRDPRIPIIGEFIRRHLEAAGVEADLEFEEPELDPRLFDDEDVERTVIIREQEWFDPMFWGMFKLVAELIVVRVNSGATSEEHYRSEMVNCMAMGNVPYSRLRASISEKGSRGSEMIDKHFERILNEIGDFVEPNETSRYLQQGSYQLKTSVWDSELCPVFFMMRSTSIKQAREVFSKMELRERKNAADKGDTLEGGVKMEERFWVPFRLIDFNERLRHRGIAQIYKLLLSERFILHCVAVLTSGQDSAGKFHDATIQLAVYLMTLGVKYAQQYEEEEDVKNYLKDIYHTPFRVKTDGDGERFQTICSFMIKLLEVEARKTDSMIPVYKNILKGQYDCQKVTGGRLIYLARFVTILSKLSPTCRSIIQDKLELEEFPLNEKAKKEESNKKTMDPAKLAAKEASRKRMEAIMQKSSKKSALTMQKLMQSEGMTAAEVEKVDPSQQNRKVYECPICGEQESPNTVEHPFGMLAKLSTNFLCEEQMDASIVPITDLLAYDAFTEGEANHMQMETRRSFVDSRRISSVENPQPEVSKVRPPLVGTDLKTCGHAAHIECFNAYRASLYDGNTRHADRREVGCPLCRYTVNIIVPMSFDKPYSPIKTPSSPITFSDVWTIMNVVVNKARGPVFQEDDKNVKYATNYSTRDGGGLCELWVGRKHSADMTERHSSMEKCTVSTVMVSIAVAMVERSSVLRKMSVPERRKNGRIGMTAHVMTASVATSKDVDFDVTLSAMKSLFAKVTEETFSKVPSDSPTERQSTSRESTPKPEEVPGITVDEMAALSGKISRKRPTGVESELRIKVPLFVLEPKSILTRMIAILIDNQSITKEMQREMAQNMIRAVTGWVSSYTILCLLLRLGEQRIRDLKDNKFQCTGLTEQQKDEAEGIAMALLSNDHFFNHMIQKLASPDKEVTDEVFARTLQHSLIDFLRFSSELLLHCDLGSLETVNHMHSPDISLEEAFISMGIDSKNLNLPGKANYWTLMYRNNLGWMARLNKIFQPCIVEPLAWKPRKILKPPRSFEDLFNRYFHRECLNCSTSPMNPVVCLLCGEILCIDDCCRVAHQEVGSDRIINMSEIEAHAERCSSSSGLFISITSSMVIVSRGKQAAIWGTVFLDAHKEEDRNLKRGKPLYLCETRFKWLEFDWAEQEWQRVYQWFNLSNSQALINNIRDCHLLHH